ncbi:metal-sulfur cluster assembly factor, partial [bacterium]|nr:metal-sulfur cluster assembly factor [bacterium]
MRSASRPRRYEVATPSRNTIIEALRPVIDPELNISVVDLGLIRGVEIEPDDGSVQIDLTLTSPMCPLGPEIVAATRNAALGVDGVRSC